jgi:hypothetical protein
VLRDARVNVDQETGFTCPVAAARRQKENIASRQFRGTIEMNQLRILLRRTVRVLTGRPAIRTRALIVSAALLLAVSTNAATLDLNIPNDDSGWSVEFVLVFLFIGLVIYGGINRHQRRKLGLKRANGVARLWT